MTQYTILKGDKGEFVVADGNDPIYKAYEHKGSIEADSLNEAYFLVNEPYVIQEPNTELMDVFHPDIQSIKGKGITSIKETNEGDYYMTLSDGSVIYCSIHKVVMNK